MAKRERNRAVKLLKETAYNQHAWEEKNVPKARLRGIMKGIIVDGIINQKEYPYFRAAKALTGEKGYAKACNKVYRPNKDVLTEQDQAALQRYKDSVPERYQRTQRNKANARAAAAPPPAQRRRRRRADDDVIAAAGVGINRTRSGREH